MTEWAGRVTGVRGQRIMFAVEDLNDTLARLSKLGATVVGEVVDYEDVYMSSKHRRPTRS